MKQTKLQLLICTYGADGIKRVASNDYPYAEGVEYLISWQIPESDIEIPHELDRSDISVIRHNSTGVAKNRNFAIENSSAPYALMTDDDVTYDAEELKEIMSVFDNNPDVDVFTFKFHSQNCRKFYPDFSFDLKNPPKGYYVSCIEIGFRVNSVKKTVRFNEYFGINTLFKGGEEDPFIYDAIRRKLNCRFFPVFTGTHDHPSTGVRLKNDPDSIITKSAVFSHIHPRSWMMRGIVHSLREHKNYGISFTKYLRLWLRGKNLADRHNVFNHI